MKRPRWSASVSTLVLAATISGTAQSQDELKLHVWKLDPTTGDYYTEAVVGDQRLRGTFTPATYIAPQISASITRSGEDFLFGYEIVNGVGVRQPIRACDFVVLFPAEAAATPDSWILMMTPTRSRITWLKLTDEFGLPPGQRQRGFAIRAGGLPGVREAECRGHTPPAGVEQWFSDEARHELDLLLKRNTVTVPIVGPAIPIAAGDSLATIAGRIRAHFAGQLKDLDPTERQRIVAELIDIERLVQRRQSVQARQRIATFASSLSVNRRDWSGEVLRALRADLEYIQTRLTSRDSQ